MQREPAFVLFGELHVIQGGKRASEGKGKKTKVLGLHHGLNYPKKTEVTEDD